MSETTAVPVFVSLFSVWGSWSGVCCVEVVLQAVCGTCVWSQQCQNTLHPALLCGGLSQAVLLVSRASPVWLVVSGGREQGQRDVVRVSTLGPGDVLYEGADTIQTVVSTGGDSCSLVVQQQGADERHVINQDSFDGAVCEAPQHTSRLCPTTDPEAHPLSQRSQESSHDLTKTQKKKHSDNWETQQAACKRSYRQRE